MGKYIAIFFGPMGCGKSHLGRHFSKSWNLEFVEGDEHLPDDMKARVGKFLPPSKDMLDRMVEKLKEEVASTAMNAKYGVLVSQALYRNSHREELYQYFKARGFNVDLLMIKVSWWQNIKNLWSRKRGFLWVLYWIISRPFFEKPIRGVILDNNPPYPELHDQDKV